jgi:hypothetical protein
LGGGNCEELLVLLNINTGHPHTSSVDDWVASILGTSSPSTQHNWIQDPFQKRTNAADWLATQSQEDMEMFYNVATRILLDLDAVRLRPELTKFAANSTPRDLWAVFCSPFAWF